ncbi:MAG: SDR family oxidoreductase [Chloroflexi bacterium]|jgi:NAD(P)-dependent dehydrogenase (short-subunit alcohol dehydrogenase family)|nr:SDR family oxidoreductase [Chloroflexota bacterium]MBT7081194.1 SDR family oxidoreductase [Chloroflexota bacterium]MBT7290860.1 SDR family oxidoreductase [Chloroflexota bacterium]
MSNSIGTPLAGRVAIITGGGSGIGRGIAIRMARAGASVVVAGRRMDILDKVCDEIKALGGQALAVPTDVSQKADVDKLIQTTIDQYGKIDILVNCAGIANVKTFVEISDEKRDDVWNTNLKGTWDCSKAAVPYMIKQKYGRIINISSVTGPMVANKGWTAYAASKGAISGFTRALALDLAQYGITVNAICPGWIKRDPTAKGAVISDRSAKLNASIPLGRVGQPEEVGDLAVFLASDGAAYITGTETVIDGGNIIQEQKGDF